MRLTRYTDYGLRVLTYLALKSDDELSTIKEIAERYGISENHLMKVVHRLGKNGFLETIRGRSGGIRIGRAPEDINLGAVVRCCEDDMRLVECFDPETNSCPIASACVLPPILDEALAAFLNVLDRYTLAELIVPHRKLAKILRPAA